MGRPEEEAYQVLTPEAYHTHVAWHAVRTFYQGEETGEVEAGEDEVGKEEAGEEEDNKEEATSEGET